MNRDDKAKKKTHIKNTIERDANQKRRAKAIAELTPSHQPEIEKPSFLNKTRQEFTVFTHLNYQEREQIPHQIEMLTSEIRQEIFAIKKTNQALMTEMEQIEKQTLSVTDKNAGIYHVRFLESILSYLKNIGAKIKEGRTWAAALVSKKAKRGSLFVTRSKKKGTQYSLSQELQSARSVM